MGRWIPDKELDFVAMCVKWKAILSNEQNMVTFKWISALCAAALTKITVFLDAEAAFRISDNTVNRTRKTETRRAAVKAIQEFADSSVRKNPFMSEADRREMGIRIRRAPVSRPMPDMVPGVMIKSTVSHLQHLIVAVNVETGRKTKPTGVLGVRFAWQVGGDRPESGEDLKHVRFSRKPEMKILHTEPDRGKLAYYAVCYENARGESGPWSFVADAYIS